MNRLYRSAVCLVVVAISVLLPVRPAAAQSQTPGQITQFDPNLNVVDSVITQDPTGNIGVGTATPAAKLDVTGGNLNIENSSPDTGNILKGGQLFIHNFGTENTFLGINAGNFVTSDFGMNTGVGYEALEDNTIGYGNTALGAEAMESNTSGFENVAVGQMALKNNDFGYHNTAIGERALSVNTTGINNTASGAGALGRNSIGGANTAVGTGALSLNGDGNNNTAIGVGALNNNFGGSNNTAVGALANISGLDLFNVTAIGYGATVNVSNKIRLGNNQVTVIEGQVPYTFTSDRNQKENFQPVDADEVLRKLGRVYITSWNYKGHDAQQFRHYGPVAQEFFAAFGHDSVGTIGTPTTINSGDLEGILMIAVQALEKQNVELRTKIEALERLVKGTTAGVQ